MRWLINHRFMENKMPNIMGNHGFGGRQLPAQMRSVQGFGKQAHNSIVANLSITGSNESVYVQATSLLCLLYDQGMSMQAVGCDIDIEYTNENWDFACSKEANDRGAVHWCNKVTVKQNTIEVNQIPAFCALKITFNGTGICYLAAR